MFFIVAVFAIFALYNVRLKPRRLLSCTIDGNLGEPRLFANLGKDETLSLKGVSAVMVIFHHIAMFCFGWDALPYIGKLTGYFGTSAVALFFFLSAYGLTTQLSKRGKRYLKTIFLYKMPLLYIQLVIYNCMWYIFLTPQLLARLSSAELLLRVFGLDWLHFTGYSWFFYSLLIGYMLFCAVYFVCGKLHCEKWAPLTITVLSAIFIALAYTLPFERLSQFAVSFECFPLGLLYASYKTKSDRFLHRCAPVVFVFTALFYILGLWYYIYAILSALTCLATVCFGYYFSYSNKITRFLGRISLWIYLLHGIFINIAPRFVQNEIMLTLAVTVCSVAAASAVWGILQFIFFLTHITAKRSRR